MGTELSGRESQKFDPDQKKKFYPLWLEGKGKKVEFSASRGGGAARVIFHFLIFYHVIMLGSDL